MNSFQCCLDIVLCESDVKETKHRRRAFAVTYYSNSNNSNINHFISFHKSMIESYSFLCYRRRSMKKYTLTFVIKKEFILDGSSHESSGIISIHNKQSEGKYYD